MEKNKIIEAYQFRHACKEFDPAKKIAPEDFELILETGRLSPSSFGFEPGKFVVLQNDSIRRKLLPITWGAQKQLPTASHFVIVLARKKQSMAVDSEHIQYMMREIQQLPEPSVVGKGNRYYEFLESDFQLLQNDRLMFEWASRQTYIALGNMMTTAAFIGVDSCPIEGFQKDNVEQLLEEEGILDRNQFGVACMVAFGYRVREPREKTRQPIDRVVQWVE
jgi:nitroreductase